MNVTKVTILLQDNQADHVSLQTDLPEPTWPWRGKLSVDFRCAAGRSRAYVAEHFPGIEVEELDYRGRGRTKFAKEQP